MAALGLLLFLLLTCGFIGWMVVGSEVLVDIVHEASMVLGWTGTFCQGLIGISMAMAIGATEIAFCYLKKRFGKFATSDAQHCIN